MDVRGFGARKRYLSTEIDLFLRSGDDRHNLQVLEMILSKVDGRPRDDLRKTNRKLREVLMARKGNESMLSERDTGKLEDLELRRVSDEREDRWHEWGIATRTL